VVGDCSPNAKAAAEETGISLKKSSKESN